MEMKEENRKSQDYSYHSYLVPRVPSITGFGQRNLIGKPTKVLQFSVGNNVEIPKIDVCLRLKPRCYNVSTSELDTLTIMSDDTVACSSGNAREDGTKYTFSRVFGPDVDQKNMFDTWMHDKVLRFLNGNDELLFTYGATNSGKTYTIHGTLDDPGMIPRTLLFVFDTLNDKLMSQCKYKPSEVAGLDVLNEDAIKREECTRKNILDTWWNENIQDQRFKTSQIGQSHTFQNNCITKMFDLIKGVGHATLDHGNVLYVVWVSYSEIYKESIYDLLATYSPTQKRTPLELKLDADKNVYVRDLSHVFVQSAEEACKVMFFGKNNLMNASENTKTSSSSYYSHSIFTLKLLRVEDIENPKTAVVSSISFCELAGSKLPQNTLNIGDRHAESRNRSTSLTVLTRCFSVLRENQKRGENKLVPCRESKLTMVFRTALTDGHKTHISVAVDVDSNIMSSRAAGTCELQTKQVLFMFAVARSTNKTRATSKPAPSLAAWPANQPKTVAQTNSKPNSIAEDEHMNEPDHGNAQMLPRAHCEIQLEENLTELRREILAEFRTILDSNETFYKNQKAKIVKNRTKAYENKIKKIKDYYSEEIRERDEQLAILQSNQVTLNNHESDNHASDIGNYEHRIAVLVTQNEELLAEINTLKNTQAMESKQQNAMKSQIKNYENLLKEECAKYERRQDDLYVINDEYDVLYRILDEKDLEIERLTDSLEAKCNIVTDMEEQREILIFKKVEQKKQEIVDKHLETIVRLESTIEELQAENNMYEEANNAQVSLESSCCQKQCLFETLDDESYDQNNTQVSLECSCCQKQCLSETLDDESYDQNENNSKSSDKDLRISILREHAKHLELKLKVAEITAEKPKNKTECEEK